MNPLTLINRYRKSEIESPTWLIVTEEGAELQVTAPADTTLTVSWGDGTPSEDYAMTGEVVTLTRIYDTKATRRIILSNTGNTEMTSLVIDGFYIESSYCYSYVQAVNVAPNTKLTELDIGTARYMMHIDVSKNALLEILKVRGDSLLGIDLSNNVELQRLDLDIDQINSLDLSALAKLEVLQLVGNSINSSPLSSLDISQNTALTGFYVSFSNITSMDFSANTALKHIQMGACKLTALNTSTLALLESIYIYDNDKERTIPMASLDLSANVNLDRIYMSGVLSGSGSIDISSNVNLTSFSVNNVSLTSMDFTNNTQLNDIRMESCELPSEMVNYALACAVAYGSHFIFLAGQTPPAPPTGQGITDKNTLIANGHVVETD
jgi:hypothetical protein